VDDDGLAELGGERQLGIEDRALPVARGAVAVEVEAGLADGDRERIGEQLCELVDPVALGVGLVRMDPENREDALVAAGEVEGDPAALDRRPDGQDSRHAGLGRSPNRGLRILERIEMRVRVDHAAADDASTRGKSGEAGSIPSAASAVRRRTRSSESPGGCRSASRMRGAVSGRYGETATATAQSPSARS